ncbi:putative monovalent cation/H+ antiporter subunit F [Corynebacterium glaucum]|uniref:Putative monovalent cation/H+ antiporter subunit F n=1 Tax=Corynebacterium glaucum TaxID=187491 RepID=A0A1Q2HZ44_9CORY|nr:monovalent cation/H+ antiporter complex subunit F [Corynebacterium glaucum]AQQ16118.1 putative monovalent cation/H+ antiporter subunit F [Corynebacterium glaucum]WJZ08605.1 putative monovalent cation/H+ antiporter subunit F [Corynebacterium glaucum]
MDATVYNIFLGVAAVLIAVGFVILAWRVIVGPDSMDRVLGNDAITASLQCALALYICWTLDTTVVNVMIVIALLGFISSLSVARFRKRDGSL